MKRERDRERHKERDIKKETDRDIKKETETDRRTGINKETERQRKYTRVRLHGEVRER